MHGLSWGDHTIDKDAVLVDIPPLEPSLFLRRTQTRNYSKESLVWSIKCALFGANAAWRPVPSLRLLRAARLDANLLRPAACRAGGALTPLCALLDRFVVAKSAAGALPRAFKGYADERKGVWLRAARAALARGLAIRSMPELEAAVAAAEAAACREALAAQRGSLMLTWRRHEWLRRERLIEQFGTCYGCGEPMTAEDECYEYHDYTCGASDFCVCVWGGGGAAPRAAASAPRSHHPLRPGSIPSHTRHTRPTRPTRPPRRPRFHENSDGLCLGCAVEAKFKYREQMYAEMEREWEREEAAAAKAAKKAAKKAAAAAKGGAGGGGGGGSGVGGSGVGGNGGDGSGS